MSTIKMTKLGGLFGNGSMDFIKEYDYKEPVYFETKPTQEHDSPEVIAANNNFKQYLEEHFYE